MFQPIFDFLIRHGVTNLIDVDGLIYAPVVDLLLFFIRYSFVAVILALLVIVAFGSLWRAYNLIGRSSDDD